MKTFAWLAALSLVVTMSACHLRRGAVEPGPGETPEELSAAGRVLHAVAGSVPQVVIRISSPSGTEERRTVGVVVGDPRRVLVDAAALSLQVGDGAEIGHTRAIEAVFHPGAEGEQTQAARIVHESAGAGLALLSLEGHAPSAVSLGDDVADGARAVLISIPMNARRLVAESGRVQSYVDTDEGRFMQHTAGQEAHATGAVFGADGELIGLQVTGSPGNRMAIPAVEISRRLQTPGPGETVRSESGEALTELLAEMRAQYRRSESGAGFIVSPPGGTAVRVRQTRSVISAEIDLGRLHVGNAIDALRSNYSDPVGACALKPHEGSDRLVWVARISAEAATADYLDYVIRTGVLQTARWQQIAAGQEPEYPYAHYPSGDEDELTSELAAIVHRSGLPTESSGQFHKIDPDADVPVFVNEFRGMAYIHAYSGGMPGSGEAEQEQIARTLVRRNWELRLGRLSLDQHLDLAWEAQVPVEHLTAECLSALVRICQDEVARLRSEHGSIPFNED
ncbi:MAG: S1 family peptidase [Armatimonadota bacterium]